MNLAIACGSGSRRLASAVAARLGANGVVGEVERFPDGELRPSVPELRGVDVFVVASTGPPANDHIVELLLLIDACRRAGADRVTAVVPYLAYARQDRRNGVGQAIGARVVATALGSSGADRLVAVDPHNLALEAAFGIPVEMLSAVSALSDSLLPEAAPDAVVVAPDFGAAKLAERYGALLGLPVVVVRKSRVSGSSVRAKGLVGEVEGRHAVIVDDMISTGATIASTVELLLADGALPGMVVAATHGLFVGGAVTRLAELPLRRVLVTDSLELSEVVGLPLEVTSIVPLLAEAIRRLHQGEPLEALLAKT